MNPHIDVIATTISGSIKDWGKIKRIVPLFNEHGMTDVNLCSTDSHAEARRKTAELMRAGGRIIISAGGSGTFNAVLEGCFDSGRDLKDVRIGFLRKGSADLIGKTLGMPDEIEAAIDVFAKAIRDDRIVPCDVLLASDSGGKTKPRRFVGYGGAEIFGRIPHFTENRFIKYYKGVLSQLFGDLGPFFVGTSLATTDKLIRTLGRKKRQWKITVDNREVEKGRFNAIIIVNGYLGPDLPFAKGESLGSGKFYVFTIADRGFFRLARQLKHAWDGSIMNDPEKWGFGSYTVGTSLQLQPLDGGEFPINTDGSTMFCHGGVEVAICDRVHLLSS